MYATFRWYSDPDLADRLAARADEIRAVIGPVPGLQAYYLVRTDGGTVSVTIADDKAGTDASTAIAASWIRDNMPEVAGSPPSISGGEVLIST